VKKKAGVEQEKAGHVRWTNQSLSFEVEPGTTWDLRRRTEIIPVAS
jgi:hypothetical protein